MCDNRVHLDRLFETHVSESYMSDTDIPTYVWAFLNLSPSICLCLVLTLFFTSLFRRGSMDAVIIRNCYFSIVVILLTLSASVPACLQSWHAFDLASVALCHNTSQSINISCTPNCTLPFRNEIFHSIDIIISWRPFIYCVFVLLSLSSIVQVFVRIHVFVVLSCLLFVLVLLLNVLSFFQQTMCANYFGCTNCDDFGIESICDISFFNISLWYASVAFMCVLHMRRRTVKKLNVRMNIEEWVEVTAR